MADDVLMAVEDDPQVIGLKARDEQLTLRLAALSAEVEKKRVQSVTAYRDLNAHLFVDFNWKMALAGGAAELPVKLPGLTAFLCLANGTNTQLVNSFLQGLTTPLPADKAKAAEESERRAGLLPITQNETDLLIRFTGLEANGQRLDLMALPLDKRLTRIRTLSTAVQTRLINIADVMESWMNAQLELEVGNS